VVLAGHSQGSVIAAATVLQLVDDEADRQTLDSLALLTYGSVLRRLYSHYFPAYFGHDVLIDLARRLPRWRNLWRLSDQLGGPIDFDRDTLAALVRDDWPTDRRLVDPTYRAGPGSRPAGHSHYPTDPAFQQQVGELAAALPHGEPVPGTLAP
jgi:hypothetical protein